MAEDFGDYSGEKLFDWLLRIGQDAGGAAALSAADHLKEALANARRAARPGEGPSGAAGVEAPEPEGRWAKLDMHEFASIEDWPTLQQLIGGKLASCGITREWYQDEKDRTYLLFKADDAPEVARAFDELIEDADAAKEKVSRELAESYEIARDRALEMKQQRERRDAGSPARAKAGAGERLKEKAEMARSAAEELRRRNGPDRELSREAMRERAQGR